MPTFTELDDEQLRVYQGAPPNGSVLVVGPPGTGKTIMAFHRAQMLRQLGHNPSLIMYNSVLSCFVSAGHGLADGIDVKTMHKWVTAWCYQMTGKPAPSISWDIQWERVQEQALKVASNGGLHKANWGHLIIDEGQDFPSAMYEALSMLAAGVNWEGRPPALTVFADENQRLNAEQNSTIAQIRECLRLVSAERVFHLRRNYRNTRQVADFAAHFYCGLSSGIPEPPERKGPLPVVHLLDGPSKIAPVIAAFVRDSPPMEVGVICPKDRWRKRLVRELGEAFENENEVVLQSYGRKDPVHNSASKLVFDSPSVVTVINRQSCKGLEFDAVFVVDPFLEHSPAAGGQQQFKMNMYVMCSRARTHLRLLFVSAAGDVRAQLPSSGTFKEAK